MASIPVDFDTLKNNHPSWKEIKNKIGGPALAGVKAGWETCCIQVSYALNRSGAVIEKYDFNNEEMGRQVRAVKSNDSMNYIFEVSDMKVYLNNRYGIAENYNGTKQEMINEIRGRHGLIAFGHRHIDLWEGERFHWQDLWGVQMEYSGWARYPREACRRRNLGASTRLATIP